MNNHIFILKIILNSCSSQNIRAKETTFKMTSLRKIYLFNVKLG